MASNPPINPTNPEVRVAGLPVVLGFNAVGFYATATFQNVFIDGSPVVFHFDPPVATIEEVSLPGLLVFLLGVLANGGSISL